MSKRSPTTYKVGSIGAFADWTKDVVRNPASAGAVSKKWFDTEASAAAATASVAGSLAEPEVRRQYLRACLVRAKRNAYRKGLDFELTSEFVETLWKDGRCAVTGVAFSLELVFPDAFVKQPLAPSIDRTLSSGGYTKDNVRLVCVATNFGMGQWGDGLFMTLAREAIAREARTGPVPGSLDIDGKWQTALQERIHSAMTMLPLLPIADRQKQKHHIAGLKAALKKGLAGNRAAGMAAAKTRQRNQATSN
jgi:hypothetical protein